MQARCSWLDAARDANDVGAGLSTRSPSTDDRRAVDLLDALIVAILVAPFFLY